MRQHEQVDIAQVSTNIWQRACPQMGTGIESGGTSFLKNISWNVCVYVGLGISFVHS